MIFNSVFTNILDNKLQTTHQIVQITRHKNVYTNLKKKTIIYDINNHIIYNSSLKKLLQPKILHALLYINHSETFI